MKRTSERFEEKAFEFIVVGGGMAGVCAAMEAARQGVKTALIHARPVLGGNASSEIRVHISGADHGMEKPDYAEGGLVYELMLENKARNPHFSYSTWDMVLFEAAKNQENLTVYYNTVMYDCETRDDKITAVLCVQETTEMRYRFTAPVFADCTGNGTLGYYAGAEFRKGSESKSETGEIHAPDTANNERMGNTIHFKARNMGRPVKFTPPSFAKKFTEEDLKYRMHSAVHKVDYSTAEDPEKNEKCGGVSSRGIDYGYFWIELMGDKDDIITDYENIRDDLVASLYGVWDHIKNGGDHGAQNYELEWVGMLPGTRESRRLVGDYLINENDILGNRIFEDAVCYGGWCVDLHVAHGLLDLDKLPSGECHFFDGVYTIPYRCYYSANISNLYMAGRNISATKLGMCSTRILGCCAIGGQAVGAAASLCKKYSCNPREVSSHIKELQQMILKSDGFIPGVINEDERDKARTAVFTASSYKSGCEPSKVTDGISRKLGDDMHGWVSDGISEQGEALVMTFDKALSLSEIRCTFYSDFRYPIRMTMAPNRQKQQRDGVPCELVKDYDIILKKDGRPVRTVRVRDNHKRLCVTSFESTLCDSAELRFISTNGASDITVFEVRAY